MNGEQDLPLNCDELNTINIFKPVSWLKKIDFINQLVLFNNVLISVLAEKQGGKTTFVQLLQERLDIQIKSCLYTANPSFDGTALLSILNETLELQVDSIDALVNEIISRKSPVLLIIDDAQYVHAPWLKDILTALKKQDTHPYFHLCLISDFSLAASLNLLAQDEVKQFIYFIELGVLTETETKTYVFHKTIAKDNPHAMYSETQLGLWHNTTGGCLAKINSQLSNYEPSVPSKNKKLHRIVGFITLCISLVAGGAWVLFESKQEKIKPQQAAIVAVKKNFLTSHIANWQENSILSAIEDPNIKASQDFYIPSIFPQLALEDMQGEEGQNRNIYTLTEQDSNSFLTSQIPPLVDVNFTYISFVEPIKVEIKPISKKIWSPFFYTIQLIASPELKDIRHFMKLHQLLGKTQIKVFKNNQNAWYILTMGEYETSSSAAQAYHQLPIDLAMYKPWVRSTENLVGVG